MDGSLTDIIITAANLVTAGIQLVTAILMYKMYRDQNRH